MLNALLRDRVYQYCQTASIEVKLIASLTIEPGVTLPSHRLVNSELKAPELVEKLISRIGLINVETQNVAITELEYVLNFLPF